MSSQVDTPSSLGQKEAGYARAWYTAALLTVCFTLAYIDRYVLSLLVNPVKESLSLSDTQIGLIQGVAFSVFYVAATLPLARLSDAGNRPLIISWCVAAWSFMTMICGMASSFWQLMLARIGVGVGEAGLPPGAMTMMADSFDSKRLAKATSLFMLGPFIGGGLAFLGGGAIYAMSANWTMPIIPMVGELERWQVIFFMVGAPGLLLALIVGMTLKDPKPDRVRSTSEASIGRLAKFVFSEWKFCVLYIVSVALTVMLLNAHISWLPAAMIRLHGIDEGAMGMLFGPLYLIAGGSGTLIAGWYVSRSNGDMPGRTISFMLGGVLLLFIPALLAPLVKSFNMAMILIALVVFLTSSIVALSSLPFQFVSPLAVRGQAIATLGLVVALLGTGLGPLVIGVISDYLTNKVDNPLSVALSLLAGILIPIIASLQIFVIRYHRLKRLDRRPGTMSQSNL